MKVLIGITSKNRGEILIKAIESALQQSYPNKEIWVFDDASSDDTYLLAQQYPQVRWIWNKEEKGYLYARNWMMQQKGFDLYCSLDDDSWFMENNLLAIAVDYLQKHENTAAIAFDILSPDKSTPFLGPIEMKPSNTFYGCGHLIKLDLAKAAGYYQENPGLYGGEEKDLCLRLLDMKKKTIKLHKGYIWHEKSLLARDLQVQHESLVLNDLVFCWRRAPLVMLFPYLLYKIGSHINYTFRKKNQHLRKASMKGMNRFFSILPNQMLNRKPVKLSTMLKFIRLS